MPSPPNVESNIPPPWRLRGTRIPKCLADSLRSKQRSQRAHEAFLKPLHLRAPKKFFQHDPGTALEVTAQHLLEFRRAHAIANERVELEVQSHRANIKVRRADHEPVFVTERDFGVVDPGFVFINLHSEAKLLLIVESGYIHEHRVIGLF